MFIGEVPFSGKLKLKSTLTNNFIGFLQVPNRLGDMNLMYFRDYKLDKKGNPYFFDLEFDENQTYHFDIGFLRIPNNFDYLLLSKNGKKVYPIKHQQRYYGMAIFNIHVHKPGGDIEPSDSLAVKTFVLPNTHYEAITSGGIRGCKSLVSFGQDKVPLFRMKKQDVSKCYMLTIGTGATVGFCEFINNKDLISTVKKMHKLAEKVYPNHRLGISLEQHERYDVDDPELKYGVHITPPIFENLSIDGKKKKRVKTAKGWMLDWYNNIPY